MKTKVKLETEKEVSVTDLKLNDHIGWVDNHGGKWQVVITLGGRVNSISGDHPTYQDDYQLARSNDSKSLMDMFEFCTVKELFVFTTRKELYQWLAE